MALLSDPSDGQLTSLQLGEANPATELLNLLAFVDPAPRGLYPYLKRAADLTIALCLVIALVPLLFAIALAVALDSAGPILFRQERVGRNGRIFHMLKFRTMHPERRVQDIGPPGGSANRRQRHKSATDPRVTRVGRFLRRTCLDELPQLINVILGEMSLVGPRPELPRIVATYEPWQHIRHSVPPGITGWWQVNRVADQLMHESTDLDVYYVKNCSLLLDLEILARTLGAVISGTGAY